MAKPVVAGRVNLSAGGNMKIHVLAVLSLIVSGCASRGFYAHMPLASSALMHSCALAETSFQIQKAGGKLASSVEVELQAQGESGPDGEVKISGVGPGFSAKANSSKKITFKVESLPSLDACLAWGYLPQLGLDGCFPTTGSEKQCSVALGGTKVGEGTLWSLLHPAKAEPTPAVANDARGTEP